jgi:short-subunit dehydrogenase
MMPLKGKNVLITGAASGIGLEMTRLLVMEEARIAMLDIDQKGLAKAIKVFGGEGIILHGYKCDVSDFRAVDQTLKRIKKDIGPVDILINNAAIVFGKSIVSTPWKDTMRTVEVNLLGAVYLAKKLLNEMIVRKSGHVVNISSSAGFLSVPRMGDYCMTKFALVGFTDALRMELKKDGIRGIKTTVVCPYVIDTGMFKGFTPLHLVPILKPDYVAGRIIRSIKKEHAYCRIPWQVKLLPGLKIFPARFSDWLTDLFGLGRAMDNFVGRHGR